MNSIKQKLKDLERKFKDLSQGEVGASKKLSLAQQNLAESARLRQKLATQIDHISRLHDELLANQKRIDAERQAALKEIQSEKIFQRDTVAHLDKKMSDSQRKVIRGSINALDAKIKQLRRKAEREKKQLEVARENKSKAEITYATLEKDFQGAVTEHRDLSMKILAARREILSLHSSTEIASASGRLGEVFYRTADLSKKLKEMLLLSQKNGESAILRRIDAGWQKVSKAKSEYQNLAELTGKLQLQVAKTDNALRQLLETRDLTILETINAATIKTSSKEKKTRKLKRKRSGKKSTPKTKKTSAGKKPGGKAKKKTAAKRAPGKGTKKVVSKKASAKPKKKASVKKTTAKAKKKTPAKKTPSKAKKKSAKKKSATKANPPKPPVKK